MRPTLVGVLAAQALIGSTATIFPASLAAITLGLVGPAKLAERMGRNEAFNHAGNVGGKSVWWPAARSTRIASSAVSLLTPMAT